MLTLLDWSSTIDAQPQTLNFRPDSWPDTPVAECLLRAGTASVDELTRATGLPINDVSSQLFDLELDGLVQSQPGGIYSVI